MRTLPVLLAIASLGLLAAASCSDDETAPTSAAQTTSSVAASTVDASATTTSSASGGGAPPMSCIDCLSSIPGNCSTENMACGAVAECSAWTDCFNECFLADAPDSCFIDCNEMHAAAAALYEPIYTCMCTPCSDLCSFCDLQGTGGGGTGGMSTGGTGGTGGG